ncbi:DNA repair protein RadC [Candidatus Pacearchaeota archaeon]|nr:DNA repair protein RadC [Candidatus Pacearchaeota archaeon]
MEKKQIYGLEVRVQLVRDSNNVKGPKIKKPEDVYELVEHLRESDREQFLTICLNTRNDVLSIETTAIGTMTANLVHPREVFKTAILQNAAGIIIAHNHPSGDPEPSDDDIKITNRLKECSKILEIELLDHVIVGSSSFKSLKGEGKM